MVHEKYYSEVFVYEYAYEQADKLVDTHLLKYWLDIFECDFCRTIRT